MGEYLAETIESVLANLRPEDEYFIIDGGSTDNSLEIIHKYESRITGWVSEPDKGYADALAKGFDKGTAPFQCWINSGDLLLEGALDKANECFAATNADFLFGDDFYINEVGKIISYSSGYVRSLKNVMLYGGWTPLQDACFWRRELYERVGGIDTKLQYAADYGLFLRFSLMGNCRYVPCAFSAFRKHNEQKSISGTNHYKVERALVQQEAITMQTMPWLITCSKREYFEWVVRFRARVLHRVWNKPHLAGKSIAKMHAGVY